MIRKISQPDARWYKSRAETAERVLQQQKNRWASEFRPGWVNIETLTLSDASFAKVDIARKLGHAVIVVPDGSSNQIRLYAERL